MNSIIFFGEKGANVESSCSSCTGCSDQTSNLCSHGETGVTTETLFNHLESYIKDNNLNNRFSLNFKDIKKDSLNDYPDVNKLINLTFAHPIITLNGSIKFMGPFDSKTLMDGFIEETKED